ncbi:unnamed protein product [marine sediment metagenome]|uniref:Uncharacterized protein n=1 Tax=marine sediment metagenome TaxID=412755 RepID=X1NTI6_9ZZZZ
MPKVRNHGTGTGYNSRGITGKKTTFGKNEKIYACWVIDEAERDARSRINFYQKVAGEIHSRVLHQAALPE